MSHKAAKKIRKLLNASITKQENSTVDPVREREYTENVRNRKKQLVELKSGEIKEIEVALGTLRVNSDTGRGIYKMVKRAMSGKHQGLPRKRVASVDANGNNVIAAEPDASQAKVYTEEEAASNGIFMQGAPLAEQGHGRAYPLSDLES